MTDWLIIDSVPTDGTCVDLMNGDEVVLNVYWGEPDTQDDDDPFDEGWLRDGDYAIEEGSIPTHWRPAIRGR